MTSLAALVLTYNEEDNIKDCLESLKWIEEVIVVDSYSNDSTVEIVQEHNVKLYQRKFDDFATQRNYGLDRIEADWVLVVDADERVPLELKEEVIKTLDNPEAEGYEIPRKNYFLGKWIKYCGWYPDYTLRLFKAKENRYNGLVHEGVRIKEKVEKLNNPFIHYTYRNLEHYIAKMNHYTTLDAEKKYKAEKKQTIIYILFRPVLEFVKMFIFKRGFLLGFHGFVVSLFSSYYQALKSIKLWEKNN